MKTYWRRSLTLGLLILSLSAGSPIGADEPPATVRGEMQQQDTLLWKGLSSLDVTLSTYRMSDGRLTPVSSTDLERQALPMRKWSEKPAVIAIQYAKTAGKLVKKWSRSQLSQFFTELEMEE